MAITPNIWFNGNAAEAVRFYTDLFPDSHLIRTVHYPEEGLLDFQKDLAGRELTVDFSLGGQRLVAINAGPEFRPTPALSFTVSVGADDPAVAREQIDTIWAGLSDGGTVFMPLGEYPIAARYGWVEDPYGVSWQLTLADPDRSQPFIVPSFLFAGDRTNRAEEAIEYYTGVFPDSAIGTVARYEEQTGPAAQGSLMYADFTLTGQLFVAMDSGVPMDAAFSEGVSLSVACADQEELDYFWDKLSKAGAEFEQCGWCKDQFGVSWQIVPADMEQLMQRPGAFERLMGMKKIQIDEF